ncbi:Cytochrome c2 [Candidatus Terasakiella magnetica]|uniref:Cytochrome c2 n=1 Tax=Candidatus Terasakiella magnetica TaxID=1867952 RepID=A0A1C3RKX3_9PROT|nr:c-type cytochrome [Candidatus Terasakiella magnetica]SCA57972.1 Cytochrome c2 [Candidatus Terasakiella magnetica]
MIKKTMAALFALGALTFANTEAQAEEMFGYKAPNSKAAAGVQVFHRCKKCHSMDPAKNTFGPNLRGVYMRKAASLPRFEYSEDLKKSDIVWDEDFLRAWVEGNTLVVSGTRMRHVQITDPAEQDYLIEFLKTFK